MRDVSRRNLVRSAQLVVLAVVAFFVYRSVSAALSEGWESFVEFDAATLALSWLALLVYYLSYVGGVALTLRALGARLRFRDVFTLSFVGNLAKYVPGGIWTVVGRVTLAPSFGLRRRDAAVSMVLENAFSVLGGAFVFVIALPLAHIVPAGSVWPYLVPLAAIAACVHPAVLGRLLKLAFRLARVEGDPPSLSLGVTAGLVAYFALSWLVAGPAFLLFADAVVGDPKGGLLTYAGIFSLGQVGGLLVLFAPGGIGVRESLQIATLAPVIGPAAAGLVGLSSRLWTTLLELVLSGLALLMARSKTSGVHIAADDERVGAGQAEDTPTAE